MHENKKMSPLSKTVLSIASVTLALIVSTLIMSACGNRTTNQGEDTSPAPNSVTSPTTGSVQGQSQDGTSSQNPDTSATPDNLITPEKAKSLALSHAGVTAGNIQGYREELDREDGRQVYEIEFFSGGFEFDYEIDAKTGEIIRFDKEMD